MRNRFLFTVAVLAAGVVGLSGCAAKDANDPASVTQVNATASKYKGVEFPTPKDRPQFTLTDQAGATYDIGKETAGVPTVLYFGYTNCPDVCPLIMGSLGTALSEVNKKTADQIQVVFVTTDPARDTPAALASWLAHFDGEAPKKFIGLTGTLAQVEAAQKAAGVAVAEDNGATHSALALFYSKDNKSYIAWEANATSDDIKHDMPLLADK